MYNLGDSSYKLQPKFMSFDTVDAILKKTQNFIEKYNKKSFTFIFHGGEPLLAPKKFYVSFVEKANKLQKTLKGVTFYYDLQSNGALIDKDWIYLFKSLKIHPSISIDGTERAHDMYRIDHKGKGSYKKVVAAAKLVKNKLGILDIVCVINTEETPQEVYNSFKELNADSVNFLIPDYTHDNLPKKTSNHTSLGKWMIALFDIWIKDKNRYKIPIFIGFLNRLMRIKENTRNESTVLIIESNGEIEAIDSLKACGNNFTKTSLNILKHNLDDIETSSLGKLYFSDYSSKLCYQCEQCPLKDICTGGRLVHRYSQKNGFNNPSIYCNDLIDFIAHIQHYFIRCFPELHESENIEKIDPKEIREYLQNLPEKGEQKNESELEQFATQNLLSA